MDKAGYNPIGTIEFWKRMKQGRQCKQPLLHLSTHPVDENNCRDREDFYGKKQTIKLS